MSTNIAEIIKNNISKYPKINNFMGNCENDKKKLVSHYSSKYICKGCKSLVCSYCINKDETNCGVCSKKKYDKCDACYYNVHILPCYVCDNDIKICSVQCYSIGGSISICQ